jgi:hypothetical protein
MKRIFALLLACFLLTVPVCGMSLGGHSSVPPRVPEGFVYAGSTITSIGSNSGLDTSYTMTFPAGQEGLQAIAAYLSDKTLPAVIRSADGTRYSLNLSVTWETDKLDPDSGEAQILTGTPVIPDGAAVADAAAGKTASVSVRFEQSAAPKTVLLTGCAEENFPGTAAFAVEQGADSAAVLERLNALNWTMKLTDGAEATTDPLPLKWDLKQLDLTRCGIYTAVGSPVVPDGYALAEGFCPAALFTVVVQAAGAPDLTAAAQAEGGSLFPWVTPACALTEMSVWMKVAQEPWKQLTEGYELRADGLLLAGTQASGVTCFLQVDYPGGRTRQAKFTYSDSGAVLVIASIAGDRDGGDSSGLKPVPPPQENESQTAPLETAVGQTDSSGAGNDPAASTSENGDPLQTVPAAGETDVAAPSDPAESASASPDVPEEVFPTAHESNAVLLPVLRENPAQDAAGRTVSSDTAPAQKETAVKLQTAETPKTASPHAAAQATQKKSPAPSSSKKAVLPARTFPLWMPFCLLGLGFLLGGFLLHDWRKVS